MSADNHQPKSTVVVTPPEPAPHPYIPSASRLRHRNADHLQIRRELLDLLLKVILEEYHHDEWIAAFHLGTSQQRAWDLLHERIERFNSETLIAMLQRYGVRLGFVVLERRHVRLHEVPGPW